MSAEPEYTTHTRVTISIPHEDAMKLVRAGVGQTDERQWAGNHSTADLLDALDATANTDVKHRAAAYEEATRYQQDAIEWRDRTERAERDLARVRSELERTRNAYQSELSEAEESEREALEKATAIAAERDAWKNRATVAEAAMSAVLAAVDQHPDPCEAPGREYSTCGWKRAFQDVHAIVQPKPALTLPTEAGVRFEARYRGEWETYTTYSDGNGNAIYRGECGFNDAEQIMAIYTDHRLLGADQ